MIVLAFPADEAQRVVEGVQTVVTYPALWIPETGKYDLRSLVGQTVAVARLCIECGLYACDGGAIVGSVTVAACVPVVDYAEPAPKGDGGWIMVGVTSMIYRRAEWDHVEIHDQFDFADFTPGRWALILTDPAGCAPIPYTATGPIGEWTP